MRVRKQSSAERRELKKNKKKKRRKKGEAEAWEKKTQYANEAEQKSELKKTYIKSHQRSPPLCKLLVWHRQGE